MTTNFLLLSLAAVVLLRLAANPSVNGQENMNPAPSRAHAHAQAEVTVQSSQSTPYDQGAGTALAEVHIAETFSGDLNGTSTVRALEIRRSDQSASMISMQRFSGKLGQREGAFVLQGSETVANGKVMAKWSVVPGSGTGDLRGLRGEGGFEGAFGKGSHATLDYWFE